MSREWTAGVIYAMGSIMTDDLIKSVTLAEVAKASGVSKSTVCRVLNHARNVSPATRDKVETAAKKMGYRPDPALSALSKRRWGLNDNRSRPYSVALILVNAEKKTSGSSHRKMLMDAFRRHVRSLNILADEFHILDYASPAALGRVLQARGFDGLVVDIAQPMYDWRLPWDEFAVVTIGYDHPLHRHHSICSDWNRAVHQAFNEARKTGRRRIGFARFMHLHPELDRIVRDAVEGCRSEQEEGDRIPPFVYSPKDMKESDFRSRFKEWFTTYRPEAVLDGSQALIWHLLDMGLSVPNQVGYASLMGPGEARGIGFSGSVHHYEYHAEIALEKVISLLKVNRRGPAALPIRSLVDCSWEDRGSMPKD